MYELEFAAYFVWATL